MLRYVDLLKLNATVKTDIKPLLKLYTLLLDKLAKAKFFSVLDLVNGYWLIPIHPRDTEN